MCNFGICTTMILSVIVVNGERWYSTAGFDKHLPKYINRNVTSQENEHFRPLVLMSPEKYHNHDLKADQDIVNSLPPKTALEVKGVVNYNHTINNVNILKRVRPRRKGNRRCLMNLNQAAKYVKPKFLEVFQVVEFEHVSCTSSSGLDGTCLPEYDCTVSGGATMGSCADGYGTCCVTQMGCDTRSAAKTSWFINPNYPLPSTDRLSCTITLDKTSIDIKQIRLDFNTFELLSPTSGACQQDQFIVSGQNMNNIIPILCGINTGQHVYVEVGEVEGPIVLSLQTESAESRLFAIKVTQLTSTDELAAPTGCLQYYRETKGYLESFNYRSKSDIGIPRSPQYLNNLNYAICIERGPHTCSVTYNNVGSMQIVNYDTDGLPVIPPGQAGVEILNCASDWLLLAATRLR